MKQKLCRRLEELEKLSAAAAARRADHSPDYEKTLAEIRRGAEAWHAGPVNQKWLAEQPPEYLGIQVRALRQEVIIRRWQQYTGKQAVLDGDGRTFDEIAEERIGAAA